MSAFVARHRGLLAFLFLLLVAVAGFVRLEQLGRANRTLEQNNRDLILSVKATRARADFQACLAGNDVRGVVEQLTLGAVGLPLLVARSVPLPLDRERLANYDALLRRSLPELTPVNCKTLLRGG